MERITSAPAALSPVATTAQVGRDFQAGGPEGSERRLGAVSCRILQSDLCRPEDAVPRRGFHFAESLTFLGGEGGDENQAGDVAGVGGSIRDHRTGVRVADGERAAGNLLEETGHVGRIMSDAVVSGSRRFATGWSRRL
jgi:hypothetical protein